MTEIRCAYSYTADLAFLKDGLPFFLRPLILFFRRSGRQRRSRSLFMPAHQNDAPGSQHNGQNQQSCQVVGAPDHKIPQRLPCAQSDARRHSVARPNRHTFASPGAQSNCPPQPGVPAGIYPSCGGHRHTGIWRRSRHGAGGGDPGRHAGNRVHPGGRTLSGARRLTLKQEWRPKGPPLRLSITPPTKGFGGEDSVKGNRQGSLSRWIKRLFGTFPKFQKVRQPVEKTFSTG